MRNVTGMIFDGPTGVYAPIDLVIRCQNARAQAQIDADENRRKAARKTEMARQEAAKRRREQAEEKERLVQERILRNRVIAERAEAVRQIEEESKRENVDPSVARFRLLDLD